jgi:hypothetical protein
MAFPHPKSRQGKYRKKDKSNERCVVWDLVERTINIPDYGNAKDEMNPAKNPTFDASVCDVYRVS